MNSHSRTFAARLLAAALLLAAVGSARAAVRYVDVNSTNSAPPHISWATAATNIQDAVDAAVAGDEIVVTNGIYATGGRDANRVMVDKPLSLRSVNGPEFTTIDGGHSNRCVYLANGAVLSGFIVTNGFARRGGGLRCESTLAVVSNCVVSGNTVWDVDYHQDGNTAYGGGAYGGMLNNCILSGNHAFVRVQAYWGLAAGGGASYCTLNNCALTDNSTSDLGGSGSGFSFGGGAYYCTLNNCTVTGNSAAGSEFGWGYGGGVSYSTLNNCIVYYNTSTNGANYDSSSTLNYSCTTPLPTNGVGNITNTPLFVNSAAGNYRLRPDSPCIDAGTNLSASITNDLDGRPRPLDGNGDGLAAFDMGAYEYRTPLLVWQDSPNPTPPHADWRTAAHTIQDAVDAAVAGDEIVVTNGVYATGWVTHVWGASLVAVDKPLALRSLNGPQSTTIDGGGSNRCVSLTSGARLHGFTLTNGFAGLGGGVSGGTLEFCTLVGNRAYSGGGGADSSTLNNCRLAGNSAVYGGGASGCILNDCTVSGNSVRSWAYLVLIYSNPMDGGCSIRVSPYGSFIVRGEGGGVYGGTLNNCILSENRALAYAYFTCQTNYISAFGGGAARATLNNCTLSGNTAEFSGGGAYVSTLNNCIVYFNGGANYDSCTLNYSCTTPLPTNGVGNITNAPLFVNLAAGNYRLRADSPCIDAGTNLSASITNDLDGRPRPLDGNGDGLVAFDMGAYEYRTPLLVWQDSPNPTPPHADWATAAHTIQDAVDDAVAGDEIVVTNGIYATGGRATTVGESWTNRVAVDKPLSVRSVNGPQFTSIDGGQSNRCVYLAEGASLTGFTLANGFSGRGAAAGGGAHGGTLNNCILTGNSAAHGGGACVSTLNNCTLTGNVARGHAPSLNGYGGGALDCVLNNCTLVGNSAYPKDFSTGCCGIGGGAYSSTLNNCIVYFNNWGGNYLGCTLNYSCTTPLPTDGVGNITNAPLFVDLASGNLRLQSNSPCINAGLNAFAPAGPDLEGNLRIVRGTVDIGAYEFQSPASQISYAWLQQFNLPIDGSADAADPDGDHFDNHHEWRAGTGPSDAGSLLRLLPPVPLGPDLAVAWQSVPGRAYALEGTAELTQEPQGGPLTPAFSPAAGAREKNSMLPRFTVLGTNLPAAAGTNITTFIHSNAAGSGPWFYRVVVE